MQELTDKQLAIGSFFTKYRTFWQRLAIFSLFFIDLAFIFIVALRLVVYMGGTFAHQRVLHELTQNNIPLAQIHQRSAGEDIRVARVKTVRAANGRVDAVAEIINPNTRLLAEEFTYQLVVNGTPQRVQTTFVLPGERKELLAFGALGTGLSDKAQLQIHDTKWQRVNVAANRAQILDNIEITDVTWSNAADGFRVRGTLANNSGRGFWAVGLPVVVRRSSDIVGINFITLLQVDASERRNFEYNWNYSIAGVTNVTIEPEINVYDDSVFMTGAGDRVLPDPSGLE